MRTTTHGTRRVATAAIGGAAALAIVGGSVLTATAANASGTTYRCITTNGGTVLVDFTDGGAGLINLGSTAGLVGVATGTDGVGIGLLGCVAAIGVGSSPSVVLVGTPVVPGSTPTVPIVPAPAATIPATTPTIPAGSPSAPAATPEATPSLPDEPTTPAATATPATSAPAESTSLDDIKVGSSATTVYPAKDGYKDSVTFSIKGLNSSASKVAITGSAVLRKGTTVVKTWDLSSGTTMLSWNGRVGKSVKAGLYVLTVTAWSADGTMRTTTMKVRVSAKHLVQRTITVKSKEIAHRTTAVTPAKVLSALKLGTVKVRIRTVATVRGTAKLVFYGNGSSSTVPLKDGTHTQKAVVVPKGLERVSIGHRWKKGAATLTSLRAIFSYQQLV